MKKPFRLPLDETLSAELREMPPEAAVEALQHLIAYTQGESLAGPPEGAETACARWVKMVDISRARAEAGRAGGNAKACRHFATSKNNFATSKQAEAMNEAVRMPDGFNALAGLEAFM